MKPAIPAMTLRFLLPLLLACATALYAQQEPAPTNKPAPPPKDPALAEITDVPGLPRVLLIGDSISMGYTLPVRAKLQGRANVHHPPENCGPTERGLTRLDAWLGDGRWDVIHFNFGLHDLKYLDAAGKYVTPDKGKQVASLEVYEKNLRQIVERLKKTGAKLIFATTTPVPAASQGRVEGDDRRYNEVALKVMKEESVAVDNLGSYVHQFQAGLVVNPSFDPVSPNVKAPARKGDIQLPHNVHFTAEGYDKLAEQVVVAIAKELPVPQK